MEESLESSKPDIWLNIDPEKIKDRINAIDEQIQQVLHEHAPDEPNDEPVEAPKKLIIILIDRK